MGTLNIIIIFLSLEICFYIKNRLYILQPSNLETRSSRILILITFTAFLSWGAYTYIVAQSIKKIITGLLNEATKSEFQIYSNLASSANTSFIDLTNLILNVYGQFIILVFSSLFLLIYILFLCIRKSKKITFHTLFFSVSFLFFLVFSIFTLMVANIYQTSRNYILVMFFSLFLIPSCFSIINANGKIKKSRNYFQLILLFLVLISVTYFSIFNFYFSPSVKATNEQVALNELAGMETFFKIRDDKIPILEFGISQDRFYNVIYSRDANRTNIIYGVNVHAIDHFGYKNSTSFSNYYKDSRYFLLNDIGRKFYPYLYPDYKEKWRFTQEDFDKLKEDAGVHMIYMNGNLEIYLTKNS